MQIVGKIRVRKINSLKSLFKLELNSWKKNLISSEFNSIICDKEKRIKMLTRNAFQQSPLQRIIMPALAIYLKYSNIDVNSP